MLNTYLIEEKRSGTFGATGVRVVQGTHVTIEKGHFHVWNAHHEAELGRRPVASVPIERLVTFKMKAVAERLREVVSTAHTCATCGCDRMSAPRLASVSVA